MLICHKQLTPMDISGSGACDRRGVMDGFLKMRRAVFFLIALIKNEETLRAWERRVSLEDGDLGRRGTGLPVSLPVSRSE